MEGQIIIKSIFDNPEILSLISGEIFLLKFLRLNKNNDIRNLIIKMKDFSILPIGYVSKILEVSNSNFIHLYEYNNNYYIINNYFDYKVDNDNVVIQLKDDVNKLSIKDIHNMNRQLVQNTPDIIVVQHQNSIDINSFVDLLTSKEDIQYILNFDLYNEHPFNNINGNTYNLNVTITDNYDIYFKSTQGENYIYSDGIIKKYDSDYYSSEKNSLISIYSIDATKYKKVEEKSKSIEKVKTPPPPPKIDILAKLIEQANKDKEKYI